MEGLEGANALAKQVLSQLSYTPTVGTTFILRHLREFQNPFLRFSALRSIAPSVPRISRAQRMRHWYTFANGGNN